MKLIVNTSTDGTPLRARVRMTMAELDQVIKDREVNDMEPEEAVDLKLDEVSEYQLLLGLKGQLESWDNEATLGHLQTIVNKS